MKCRVCREPAVIDVRRHNANFCPDHFLRLCRDQVAKAIEEFEMIAPGERVLVAVSGGKDSLALWDILLDLGYEADGLTRARHRRATATTSTAHTRRLRRGRGRAAASRSTCREELRLRHAHRPRTPPGGCRARRAGCPSATCSTRPRVDGGYDVVVTGHNLDDEAAVLFGNVLRWQTEYLGRQLPVLPAGDGFPRKVKPLVRLAERETAAYCVLRGIDYIVEECPMAAGNRHLGYKEALNAVEAVVPGHQARLLLRLPRAGRRALFAAGVAEGQGRPTSAAARGAARRPPPRCAPSAGWSSGRPAPSRWPLRARSGGR